MVTGHVASSPGAARKSGKGPGYTYKNSRICLDESGHVRPLPIIGNVKNS